MGKNDVTNGCFNVSGNFFMRRQVMKSAKVLLMVLSMLPAVSFGTTFDFESGDLSGWTIRAEDDSDWSIATDTTDSNNKVLDFYDDNTSGDILYTGEGTYTDGSITWDMYYNKSMSQYNRVYIRAADPGAGKTEVENGYYWRPSGCQLRKLVNSSATTLATGTVVDYATHWTKFKAEVSGNTISIYKWDEPNTEWDLIVSATDNTFSSGYFGFRGIADDGGEKNYNHFDNVTIVPEPATIGLLTIGVLGLLRKK